MRHILKSIAASVLLAVVASPAWSAYCTALKDVNGNALPLHTCFGIDSVPDGQVNDKKDPFLAKDEFLTGKASIGVLNFSQYAPDPQNPPALVQPSLSKGEFTGSSGSVNRAEFSPSVFEGPFVVPNPASQLLGRFNTSPAAEDPAGMVLESAASFVMVFDSAVSAFGFYAMDVGDFGGTLTVRLFLTEDAEGPVESLLVPVVPADPSGQADPQGGSLLFFGFFNTDTNVKYRKVEFVQSSEDDGFGYDDMVVAAIADIPNPTPEPVSLALLGAALAAAGLARRHQQRRAD